jgi:hypothetical protein
VCGTKKILASFKGKEDVLVKPNEVIRTAKVCEAAVESAKTGLPVDIWYE